MRPLEHVVDALRRRGVRRADGLVSSRPRVAFQRCVDVDPTVRTDGMLRPAARNRVAVTHEERRLVGAGPLVDPVGEVAALLPVAGGVRTGEGDLPERRGDPGPHSGAWL